MRIEEIGAATLINADCREVMAAMPENSLDAIVCDPPYGLSFMGKGWDHGVPGHEFWVEALRVAKLGAYLLAFGGTRTHHRLMVAIENAGWEIRDVVMWVYGSGFPKSLNVQLAINKASAGHPQGGADPTSPNAGKFKAGSSGAGPGSFMVEQSESRGDDGGQWQGWGTALKPAWEPIILARKPLIGTVAANVLEFGTGGLNIDGCRVETSDNLNGGGYSDGESKGMWTPGADGGGLARLPGQFVQPEGRWPANLIHDGSSEVLECFPDSKGQLATARTDGAAQGNGVYSSLNHTTTNPEPRGDTGSAARFFYCAKASKSDRDSGLASREYVTVDWTNTEGEPAWDRADQQVRLLVDTDQFPPKVIGASGTQSRNATEWNTLLFGNESTALFRRGTMSTTKTKSSSTTTPVTLSYFQSSLTSASTQGANYATGSGGSPARTAANGTLYLTTTSAAMASVLGVGNAVSPTRLRINVSAAHSGHPTVKPNTLMRYLCRLVTPPGGTILDPFMGSGSTGKAALQEGFGFVGIELDEEHGYFDIAVARVAAAVPVKVAA